MANSNYACVNTKLMAMKSGMLKDEDYRKMIKASTLQELFDYLKNNTAYGSVLSEVNTEHLHREEIELPLNRVKLKAVEKLMHYLQGEEKAFFKTIVMMRADIECLRILIRGMARGESLEQLENFMVYSKMHTALPFDRLLKAKDWDSFKKALSDTAYYRLLEIYKDVSVEEDLFPIEKSLERFYYDKVKMHLEKLNQKRNKELIATVRKGIDLLNLVWFYRGKKFYHLSREELLAYSLRGGLQIKDARIQELSELKNMDAFHEKIRRDYPEYGFLFNHTKTLDLYMERRRERFLYYSYLKLFNGREDGLTKACAFIRLIDIEIEDVISIIESKRYSMSAQDTEKFLIRSFE